MEYKDYYKILGIEKNASQEEIKKKYRELAKKHHPDLNKGDESSANKLKEINEAYEVLSDEEKRKKYDMFGSSYQNRGYDTGSSYNYSSDTDFSDFFNTIFGQGGFSSSGSNRDIFNGFSSSKSARPKYNMETSLSLKDAYRGGEKVVDIKINGENKALKIKWPAGIEDGKKIRIRGKKFDIDGDIYVKINIVSQDKLEGIDIIKKVDLLPWDAYLGCHKEIETLDGKIKVKIPAKIRSGQRIKIANKGFRNMNQERGHLYLEININNPTELTEEEVELYRKLKNIDKRR